MILIVHRMKQITQIYLSLIPNRQKSVNPGALNCITPAFKGSSLINHRFSCSAQLTGLKPVKCHCLHSFLRDGGQRNSIRQIFLIMFPFSRSFATASSAQHKVNVFQVEESQTMQNTLFSNARLQGFFVPKQTNSVSK